MVEEDYSVHYIIVHADFSDSSQTIDHSSGDVAYLRLTAHAEEKRATDELKVPFRPILDAEFRNVFDAIKKIPAYPSLGACEKSDNWIVTASKLVQIGVGVYATNTITSKLFSSVGQEIGCCLDQLLCTCRLDFSNISDAPREQSYRTTYNLHHLTTQRHVRLCCSKSRIRSLF